MKINMYKFLVSFVFIITTVISFGDEVNGDEINGLSIVSKVNTNVNDTLTSTSDKNILNNIPPVANTEGSLPIIFQSGTCTLDGSQSYDPDGRIVSYEWSKISGGSMTFSNDYTGSPTRYVSNLEQVEYVFELKVTDNEGLTNISRITFKPNICGPTNDSERQALIALYNASAGVYWTNRRGWSSGSTNNIPVCDWYGVTVDITGAVIGIDLSNNGLNRNITPELDKLTSLRTLNLSGNKLDGAIPAQLGSLITLRTLNLSDNELEETIPIELGNLSSLTTLNLSNNQLEGGINPLGSLTQLEILNISNNNLSGDIPNLKSASPALNALYFDNNAFIFSDFENEYPTYKTMSTFNYSSQANVDEIEYINIKEDQALTFGTRLTSLSNHYQWQKSTDGGITFSNIGGDTSSLVITTTLSDDKAIYRFFATNDTIDSLTLERNTFIVNIIGDTPSCPVPADQRYALRYLYNNTGGDNWKNTQANDRPWDIDGTLGIPVCDWYGVIVDDNGNITSINLYNNSLSNSSIYNANSTVFYLLKNLTSLTELNLGKNRLKGPIPESIGGLSQLKRLYLSQNQFEGSIPAELGNLTNLEYLSLAVNKLSGDIPNLKLPESSLELLNLGGNAFIFEDFENEYPFYKTLIHGFYYGSQAKVDEEEIINLEEGQSYDLTTTLVNPKNHYQWQKNLDGQGAFFDIGEDSNHYLIKDASSDDSGEYRFFATNDVVDDKLILERNTIRVNVLPAIICLKGSSRTILGKNENGLQVDMIDWRRDIKTSTSTVTIVSGISGGVEQALNIPFDRYGKAIFTTDHEYPFSSFRIDYNINTTSDYTTSRSYEGTQVIRARTTTSEHNFYYDCTQSSPNYNNIFCSNDLENDFRVANLSPRGPYIKWYKSETGGEAIYTNEKLDETVYDEGGTSYWWDDVSDRIVTRTEANVRVRIAIEGDYSQVFSKYAPVPTIADIDVANNGNPVYWYSSDSSETVLETDTLLEDGKTYYGSLCDASIDTTCICRFPVTIVLGVSLPEGDPIQYLCEQGTLDDIVLENEAAYGLSLQWYDSEEGGNLLAGNTPVISNTTYYASQVHQENKEESQTRVAVLVHVQSNQDPIITESEQTFFAEDMATVANLRGLGDEIVWYSQETGGNFYSEDHPLENGIYYAESLSGLGSCASLNRIAVKVTISEEPADPLYGCELFRPEFLKHYVIDGWVNEREVIRKEMASVPFNSSKASKLFVGLLNHLKNKMMSTNKNVSNIPEEYVPVFTAEEEQLDLGPLKSYIDELGDSKNLIVYDFEVINDGYRSFRSRRKTAPVITGRAIGFSFYLDKGRSKQFKYLTPTFSYKVPVVTEDQDGVVFKDKEDHYPLLDNSVLTNDDYLKFTDVVLLTSGKFQMHADFNHVDESSIIKQVSEASDSHTVKPNISIFKYTEVAYQATPNYENTEIEVMFLDPEGVVMDNIKVFKAHGEIIDKWQKITGDFIVPNGAGKLVISLKNEDDSKVAYFDDLRIVPFDANMKTFVYHPENQRLMSELDENNYATFYEYDAEGGLIRVKKETVKGTYTIQETRSGNIKNTN